MFELHHILRSIKFSLTQYILLSTLFTSCSSTVLFIHLVALFYRFLLSIVFYPAQIVVWSTTIWLHWHAHSNQHINTLAQSVVQCRAWRRWAIWSNNQRVTCIDFDWTNEYSQWRTSKLWLRTSSHLNTIPGFTSLLPVLAPVHPYKTQLYFVFLFIFVPKWMWALCLNEITSATLAYSGIDLKQMQSIQLRTCWFLSLAFSVVFRALGFAFVWPGPEIGANKNLLREN